MSGFFFLVVFLYDLQTSRLDPRMKPTCVGDLPDATVRLDPKVLHEVEAPQIETGEEPEELVLQWTGLLDVAPQMKTGEEPEDLVRSGLAS